MIFKHDEIRSFEDFCDKHVGEDSPILEMYIAERGIVIPKEEWDKIPVQMKSMTGLNFGKDSEETLYKYTHKSGQVGPVATLDVTLPVRVDQTKHAAEQIYRWEHRWDQVDQEEVNWNVEMAAPKLAELMLSGGINPGVGTSARFGRKSDYGGLVWLYNIETSLNIIVQVKRREQRDHAFKVAVITVLRKRGMTWNRMSDMAKITISSSEARVVYVPKRTSN